MKFKIVLVLSFLSIFSNSQAQKNAAGKIIDVFTKKPIAGAVITIGDLKITSDKDGIFEYNCLGKTSATVSFIGYENKATQKSDCNSIWKIALNPTVINLDEVEVTNATNSTTSVLYQPASLVSLGTTELKRGPGLFFDDAIQTNITGMQMQRRTLGGGQQFNIRGYGNGTRGTKGVSSNFDGQGYKLYLNGIPVTDAEGITTMDDIDFASIGSVEVVKGPAGSLYGLAIAGAVHLKTIQPEKGKTSFSQEIIRGNYGLVRNTTTFQSANDKSSLLLNYGHQSADGFTLHNASKKDFANVVGTFTLNEKQVIRTYFGYSNSYDQRAGELTIAQYESNDYTGNPEYIKRDGHSNVISFRVGISHIYQFNNRISSNTSVFGTGFSSNVSSAGGWTDKTAINYGVRSTLNTKFDLSSTINLSGVSGLEIQRQDAQVLGYNMKQNPLDLGTTWTLGVNPYWIINANTSNLTTINFTSSLFSEWTVSLPKDFSILAGLGSSSLHITLNDRFNVALPTRPSKFDKLYGPMLAPHVAVNKVINENFSIYASYSKGYKAPTSSYFYITTPAVTTPATPASGRLNSDLKPEVGDQIEYGTKGQLFRDKLIYEFSYFNTVFANKMTALSVVSPASPNTTLYSYVVNGGKQTHYGLEGMVKYTAFDKKDGLLKLVSPFVNFTYAHYTYADNFIIQKTVTTSENYSGKMVAGVPKWAVNAGVDVVLKGGVYANLTYNYKDKMPITSLNNFYTSSYNLLNGKFGYSTSIGNHFNVDAYVGATNMTNTKYFIMVFANQLPDAYLPAPKNAMVFGGVNLKYTL